MRHFLLSAACISAILLGSADKAGADAVVATLTTGANPVAIAVDSVTNMIYVVNESSNSVTVINGAINATTTVNVGNAPIAVAVNPITNMVYVANIGVGSGKINILIDGATNSTTTLTVGTDPEAIAINPITNMIYVACYGSNNVIVINGATNATSTISVGNGPNAIAVNPVTNNIYIANHSDSSVTIINGATNSTATVKVETNPYAIAVNTTTNKIYVANINGTVTVINGTTDSTATVSVGNGPDAIAINPVTNKIYVTNENYGGIGSVTVIDGTTNATTTVNVGTQPNAIAINQVTNKIYVSNNGDSSITIINGVNNVTNTLKVGPGPCAVAINVLTNKIYVANYSNNITEIDGTSAPVAVTLISPSDNAANIPSNVTLKWSSVSTATGYNVQVSNTLTFSNMSINSTAPSDTLNSSLLLATKYYWRVAATNAGGSSPWATDSFYTIIPPVPSPVTLFSPSDNAKNVISNPTLKWTTSPMATGYSVQVATNSAFNPVTTNLSTIPDTQNVVLGAGIKFFWRVAATNAGGSSPWAMDSFTTSSIPPPGPTLTSPTDGATNIPLSTYLYWNASPGATSYRVQLCNSTAFVFVTDTTLPNTSRAISGLFNSTTYYWRVNASNAYGTSLWSIVDSFTTIPGSPSVPVLVYPPNGSTNIPMNSTLLWNPSPGATAYGVQISQFSNFSMLFETAVSVPQCNFGGLLNAYTTYYWHVDAINSYGTSSWATPYSFTTNGSGVLDGPSRFKASGLGYNGTLAVYSLDGRQVLKIPFTASETRETVLQAIGKIPAKGFYSYQFLNDRKVMDAGNFIVK